MKIKVQKQHIDGSTRGNPFSCMVSDAVTQQLDLPEGYRAWVGYGTISIKKGKREQYGKGGSPLVKARLEKEIVDKIKRWDQGLSPDPFEFELKFPDNWREKLTK